MHFDSKMNLKVKALMSYLCLQFLAGCAAYSKVLVNSEGQAATCVIAGEGIFGVAAAGDAYKSCLTGLRNVGFVEVEKVGSIGVKVNFESPPRVIRVIEGSPASVLGIKPNDQIIEVDSSMVKNKFDAESLIFGNPGDQRKIQVKRDSTVLSFEIKLESVIDIYSRIKKEKTFKECHEIVDKVDLYECQRFKKTGK